MAKKPAKNKTPKTPTAYSKKLADKIIEYISMGMSARKISELDGMPYYTTISKWKIKYPDFGAACFKAWQNSAMEVEDECFDIADSVIEDKDAIAKAKLRIDIRLRSVSARKPDIFGNKIDMNIDDKRKTPEELQAALEAQFKKANDLGG